MIVLSLLFALSAHADDAASNKAMVVPAPPPVQGGLDKSVIDEKIQAEMPKIVSCYNDNVKDAKPTGRVSTQFTIGGDGKVTDAKVLSSDLHSVPVENCLMGVLKGTSFPAPSGGGTVQVDYPFSFAADLPKAKKKKK